MAEEKQTVAGKDKVINGNEYGQIRIADDVIATIISMATLEVDGVAGMNGGVTSNITEMLGKKNLTKGVKLEIEGNQVTIEIYLIAYYGRRLPILANDVQNKVKEAVETMTGLEVISINVNVQGLIFDTEKETLNENETIEEYLNYINQ